MVLHWDVIPNHFVVLLALTRRAADYTESALYVAIRHGGRTWVINTYTVHVHTHQVQVSGFLKPCEEPRWLAHPETILAVHVRLKGVY